MSRVKGKYCLVTGGAQGIGLACVRELLIRGVQGVTLIDLDVEKGQKATALLKEQYGTERIIFVKCDVSKRDQVEDAFKTSYKHWKHLDIVINNAGIVNERNWESALATNCGGVLQGTLMGFQYMSKRQNGNGGVVVNVASVSGVNPIPRVPVYSATKSFSVMLGRCFGNSIYYDQNSVKVLTVCPGFTTTDLKENVTDMFPSELSPQFYVMNTKHILQSPEELAMQLVTIVLNGKSGSVWSIIGNEAKEIDFSTTDHQCNYLI